MTNEEKLLLTLDRYFPSIEQAFELAGRDQTSRLLAEARNELVLAFRAWKEKPR
jgi:hypothetical protein